VHTLAQILAHRAEANPSKPLFSFVGDVVSQTETLTRAELTSWAASVGRDLQDATRAEGRVVLFAPEGLEFAAGFFGCILAGRVVVPTYPPNTSRITRATTRLDMLIRDVKPAVFLTTPAIASRISALASELGWNDVPILTVHPREAGSAAALLESDLSLTGADSPAVIQYTSGSTSDPKGVVLTHRNLLKNAEGMQAHGRLSENSVSVSWLPPYHDMGLISGLVLPVYAGYHSVLSSSGRFFSRPGCWLEYIHRYRATITGGPNFAFDLCVDRVKDEDIKGLDLSSLQAVFNGAEPVHAATLTRFAKRFKHLGFNVDAFSPVYGLAEGTLMSTGIPSWEPPVIRNFDQDLLASGVAGPPGVDSWSVPLVSCGTPLEGHTVTINDPTSMEPLEAGKIGEIWIAGPSVSPGYHNQSGESGFQKSRSDRSSMVFKTGDLGFMSEGHLFITGRKKDLIIIRGRNVYPQDIELSAGNAHPAIDRYRVCAFSIDSDSGEQLAVVCEVKRTFLRRVDFSMITRVILEAVTQDNHVSPAVIGLVKPTTVPITTSGKVRRSACWELFLTGKLEMVHEYRKEASSTPAGGQQPDSQDPVASKMPIGSGRALNPLGGEQQLFAIEDYLSATAGTILNIPPDQLVLMQSLTDSGMDSLSLVELAHRIQSDLGLNVDLVTHENLSIAGLAKKIQDELKHPRDRVENLSDVREHFAASDIPMNPILHELIHAGSDLQEQIVTVFLRLPAHDLIDQVRTLLSRVLSKHGSFYLRRHALKHRWQFVEDAPQNLFSFAVLESKAVDPSERSTFAAKIETIMSAPFDLLKGPLVRSVYVSPGAGQPSMLALSFSHSVVDAISLRILATDLERAWKESSVQSPDIPVSPDRSAIAWASYLETYAQSNALQEQSAYWRSLGQKIAFSFAPHRPDQNADEKLSDSGASSRTQTGRLQPLLSARLEDRFPTLRQQHDVFLGALVKAWCSLSQTSSVAVTLEAHGRDEMRHSGITTLSVGNLTGRFPSLFEVTPPDSLKETVQQISRTINKIPQGGIGFGLLRHLCADPTVHKMFSDFPAPLIRFVYRGRLDQDFRERDAFKILHTGVRRQKTGSRVSGADSEILVFARREVATFSWTVEVNPGTRAHWAFPLETELSDLMKKVLLKSPLE